ncbi:MAG: TIGR01459 family HAD-type hydrolase, partial [Pseudomonadota bacterium]
SDRYAAAFVDLWGCMHNGLTAHPAAVEAMRRYRTKGGKVVLVTNSPRPRLGVEAQLETLDVPRDCWDALATSGDSARAAMFLGAVGQKVYHLGPERDLEFYEPLHIIENSLEITRVPLDDAEGIVCTGPFDPMEDPAVYRPDFLKAKIRGLKLLCANPDVVVDRGETRQWCAGALAELYTDMGGTSLYFGKPHPPIYDLARRRLHALGQQIPDGDIIAIGDGIQTDIKGALGEGIDSLFISGGLAAAETKTDVDPDPDALKAYIEKEKMTPTFAIGQLR